MDNGADRQSPSGPTWPLDPCQPGGEKCGPPSQDTGAGLGLLVVILLVVGAGWFWHKTNQVEVEQEKVVVVEW